MSSRSATTAGMSYTFLGLGKALDDGKIFPDAATRKCKSRKGFGSITIRAPPHVPATTLQSLASGDQPLLSQPPGARSRQLALESRSGPAVQRGNPLVGTRSDCREDR